MLLIRFKLPIKIMQFCVFYYQFTSSQQIIIITPLHNRFRVNNLISPI